MFEASLSRLLDLVQHELGAADARAEYGGKEPQDERLIWAPLPNGWRLVAVFERPPEKRDELGERLRVLAEAFGSTASTLTHGRPVLTRALASRRLDEQLEYLAVHASAIRAVVIDESSPVVWGSSEPRRGSEDVDSAIRTARLLESAEQAGVDLSELLEVDPSELHSRLRERGVARQVADLLCCEVKAMVAASGRSGADAWRHHLLTSRAVAMARAELSRDPSRHTSSYRTEHFGYFARRFATIYQLVLVYERRFSELHAEAAIIRALDTIERLVLALPPADPPSGAGRVMRLRKRTH
jgi:hypothetical protein